MSKEETKKETLTLDFTMNAIDRLRAEVDFTDSKYQKVVGEFLLKQFEKDENLRLNYFNKKITLQTIWDFIVSEAKKQAQRNYAVMEDDEVFGLAVHFIEDGKVKESKKDNAVLTKETKESLIEKAKADFLKEQKEKLEKAEQKRIEKEKAAKAKALEKERQMQEQSGQLSLFDF